MPRNVRNFWIEANIDGRSTILEGGPQGKDGGFDLTIYVRDDGGIVRALTVMGRKDRCNDDLTLSVRSEDAKVDGAEVGIDFEIRTKR